MSGDPYNPDYEYVAYIDEAGETGGLPSVKSPLFVFDAIA
jgi:hypothetical protein